jgi:hypothetical protein
MLSQQFDWNASPLPLPPTDDIHDGPFTLEILQKIIRIFISFYICVSTFLNLIVVFQPLPPLGRVDFFCNSVSLSLISITELTFFFPISNNPPSLKSVVVELFLYLKIRNLNLQIALNLLQYSGSLFIEFENLGDKLMDNVLAVRRSEQESEPNQNNEYLFYFQEKEEYDEDEPEFADQMYHVDDKGLVLIEEHIARIFVQFAEIVHAILKKDSSLMRNHQSFLVSFMDGVELLKLFYQKILSKKQKQAAQEQRDFQIKHN